MDSLKLSRIFAGVAVALAFIAIALAVYDLTQKSKATAKAEIEFYEQLVTSHTTIMNRLDQIDQRLTSIEATLQTKKPLPVDLQPVLDAVEASRRSIVQAVDDKPVCYP